MKDFDLSLVEFDPRYYTIDWDKYEGAWVNFQPNFLKNVPATRINFVPQDVEEFNTLYQYCLSLEKDGIMSRFVTTPSGGVSVKRENLRGPRFEIYVHNSNTELRMKNLDGRYYRFCIGYYKKEQKFSGHRAFQVYKQEVEKTGVNLEDLAISNGKEVKETIPSPHIDIVDAVEDRTYNGVHHLDINSAFNAGMMKAFPVLEPAIRHMYNRRKAPGKEYYKAVLNMTQGFMQSKYQSFKWAHISKAGYVFTNNYIEELTRKLEESGRRVLARNTDGIWYQGLPYTDENEGTDIGQWKNDHLYCRARWKSKGIYEFIEDGKYYPVYRGMSTYELSVPRDKWTWGDIYKGRIQAWKFEESVGFVEDVDN